MPRYTPSQVRWTEESYTIFNGGEATAQTLTSDWLEQIGSFSFHSRKGTHFTARKQRVQRGSNYWYAYRRLEGRIVKRYLGRTGDLTLDRLEEVACLLENPSGTLQNSLKPDQEMSLSETALAAPIPGGVAGQSPVRTLPLLLTKLAPPRLHSFLLDRSHLFPLLEAGRDFRLTLLSAPAGFGKTTLVCQWMAARRGQPDFPPVAWFSLEQSDNDPLRFWRYLIEAFRTFGVDTGEANRVLDSLAPQPPFLPASLEPVLTGLLNTLAQAPSGGILVLEDFYVITEPSIQNTVSFFLDHLPATLRLIIITRSDPPFSLARLRARNELYEIRTADLRFSQEETAILLHQALPFPLEASVIRHLHAQLEGWGAGLHLMKLALQRTASSLEPEQELPLFSLANTSLQEYFVTEVFNLQPEPVQRFLLQTSFLTRLTASLGDAVTGQTNGHEMLTFLERGNLFLEPLTLAGPPEPGEPRQWYRFHALFSEAMRNEARRRLGGQHLQSLADRASEWYQTHGYPGEAIDAALVARNYERAAYLIEQSTEPPFAPGVMGEAHTLRRWLEQMPEQVLERHPALCLSGASSILFMSPSWLPDQLTLRSLEKFLNMAEEGFRGESNAAKLGELYAFRALLAVRLSDHQAAVGYAKVALDWLAGIQPGASQIWRGLSLSIVADEMVERGHFQRARATLEEAQNLCKAAGNSYFQQIALIKLARVIFEQGQFQQSLSLSRQALASTRQGGPLHALGNALVNLAALYYEYNELETAYQHAQEALTISQTRQLLNLEAQATLVLARVQQAQGQVFVAQQKLGALLERLPANLPLVTRDIQAALAQLAFSAGDQLAVQRWATGRSPHPVFTREIEEELLSCRWLRAQGKLEEASRQLERLLLITQDADNTRHLLQIQLEMALVAAAEKNKTEAHRLLHEVVAGAFPENAMRLFLDAGEQVAILLRSLLPQFRSQPLQAYVRNLLKAFPCPQPVGTQAPTPLVEPLSPQEIRVLRLLAQHRSNADIARELIVSVNTVRTQLQSIYGKLGVHNRHTACEVAREFNLMP